MCTTCSGSEEHIALLAALTATAWRVPGITPCCFGFLLYMIRESRVHQQTLTLWPPEPEVLISPCLPSLADRVVTAILRSLAETQFFLLRLFLRLESGTYKGEPSCVHQLIDNPSTPKTACQVQNFEQLCDLLAIWESLAIRPTFSSGVKVRYCCATLANLWTLQFPGRHG